MEGRKVVLNTWENNKFTGRQEWLVSSQNYLRWSQGRTSEGKGCLTEKRLQDYPWASHPHQHKSVQRQCNLHDSSRHQIIIPPTKWKKLMPLWSIPTKKQKRLSKRNYFPTTPGLASVRLHGYQCLDKKAWNGIRHWNEEEAITQNLCYCAIFLFTYRKSSEVLYVPYQMLAIFVLLWLPISHMFCST